VEYATDVLVSGATVRSATAGFSFRRLGTVSVKGRVEAVEICALDGLVSV
jgi:class 3 adenylate cyclase